MAELDEQGTISLELMDSTLARTAALAKPLVEKGFITDAEFRRAAGRRVRYQRY